VAAKHGMKTSFLPKLFQDKAGCGSHLHLSFWWEGENIVTSPLEPYGLNVKTRSFIAGVLNHLPALMAITAPTTNSYRRIRPQCWTGAYRCWGFDNREAAVRILTDWKTNLPDHIEFKTADVTANPYLAFGAVLAAGLDGVRSGSGLGKPVDVDPDCLSDEERKALSIDRLPSNLKTTLDALEKDSVLTSALGEKLTKAYCAVKRAEYEHMKGFRLEDEVALLLERY
jgi:glutamine synthetase